MHVPVLLNQTIALLDLKPSDIVVDATIGFGGHSS
ncbi:16S rRNA (cytosine(1402)-N(4))-methyltransferase, partial [bacterium]|nr:16S rRNA (cytosine(1402)-N(4))-methyltransferase [bacterium]